MQGTTTDPLDPSCARPAPPAATPMASSTASSSASARSLGSGWGFLRPPSSEDVRGRGGRPKGLSASPSSMTHLVVLDFEWTADNKRRILPVSEITQFPSVLVRLDGRRSCVVDEFDTFVRPTLNPTLTHFSIELTAISQADVDGAPRLDQVLPRYLSWLRGHGLVTVDGARCGHWAFCTWSDADIGGQLAAEVRHKGLTMPPCFDSWIDLKLIYRRRYGEARGGLRACVERLGLEFTGRAHNGLVDCQNTAKVVLHAARGDGMYGPAHVFARPTRGLDANGHAYGSNAAKAARRAEGEAAVADAAPHLYKRVRNK
jgi:inhibitor of KinA sporulation pathway (predicted exonuclease)